MHCIVGRVQREMEEVKPEASGSCGKNMQAPWTENHQLKRHPKGQSAWRVPRGWMTPVKRVYPAKGSALWTPAIGVRRFASHTSKAGKHGRPKPSR